MATSTDMNMDQEVFEVERFESDVMDTVDGKRAQYVRVKWAGYHEEEDVTWEPRNESLGGSLEPCFKIYSSLKKKSSFRMERDTILKIADVEEMVPAWPTNPRSRRSVSAKGFEITDHDSTHCAMYAVGGIQEERTRLPVLIKNVRPMDSQTSSEFRNVKLKFLLKSLDPEEKAIAKKIKTISAKKLRIDILQAGWFCSWNLMTPTPQEHSKYFTEYVKLPNSPFAGICPGGGQTQTTRRMVVDTPVKASREDDSDESSDNASDFEPEGDANSESSEEESESCVMEEEDEEVNESDLDEPLKPEPAKKEVKKMPKTLSHLSPFLQKIGQKLVAMEPKAPVAVVKKPKKEKAVIGPQFEWRKNPNVNTDKKDRISLPDFDKNAVKDQEARIKVLRKSLKGKCRTTPTVLEFCAGGGGLEFGLKEAGFQSLGAIDLYAEAVQTLTGNFIDTPALYMDLNDTRVKKQSLKSLDVVAAGLPCQSFSLLGKRETFEHAEKGTDLWTRFIGICKDLQPKMLMIENVGACLNDLTKGNPDLLRAFADAGFDVTWRKFHAKNIKVPQMRVRMLLIGVNKKLKLSKGNEFSFKKFFAWGDGVPKTFGEIVQTNKEAGSLCLRLARKAHEDTIPYIRPGNNISSVDPRCIEELKTTVGLNFRKLDLRRPDDNKPTPTVTTGGGAVSGWSCILHPYEPRGLNEIELRRVQSFPDDYWLAGSLADRVKQIGNAVPCLLGTHAGRMIDEFLLNAAVHNSAQFGKSDADPATWFNEHVGFATGDEAKTLIDTNCKGMFWNPEANLDGWNKRSPDLDQLYPGDPLKIEFRDADGKVHKSLDAVVIRSTTSADKGKYVRFTLPGEKMTVSSQLKAVYLAHMFGIVAVTPVKGTAKPLEVYDVSYDNEFGERMAHVRRWCSGRWFKSIVPARLLPEKSLAAFKGTACIPEPTNGVPFIAGITAVVGHRYETGTRVEVKRTRNNDSPDAHWFIGEVVGAGKAVIVTKKPPKSFPAKRMNGKVIEGEKIKFPAVKEVKKEYRDIRFTNLKTRQAIHPDQSSCKGLDKCTLRFWVQSSGKMFVVAGTNMSVRPIQDAAANLKFKKEKRTWGNEDRAKYNGEVKLLCTFGDVDERRICSWVQRKDICKMNPQPILGFGAIPVYLKKDQDRYHRYAETNLPLKHLDTSEGAQIKILTKNGRFVEADVIQSMRQHLEVRYRDGTTEMVERLSTILCSRANPKPRASFKTKVRGKRDFLKNERYFEVDPRCSASEKEVLYYDTAISPKPATPLEGRLRKMKVFPVARANQVKVEKDGRGAKLGKKRVDNGAVKLNTSEAWKHLPKFWRFDNRVESVVGNWGNWRKGQRFSGRYECFVLGMHRQTMRGISNSAHYTDKSGDIIKFSDSICFANGYADDTHDLTIDHKNKAVMDYTGEGREGKDQSYEMSGNFGLVSCHDHNIPTRCIVKRDARRADKSKYSFYEYEGLRVPASHKLIPSVQGTQKVIMYKMVPYKFDNPIVEKAHRKMIPITFARLEERLPFVKTSGGLKRFLKDVQSWSQGEVWLHYHTEFPNLMKRLETLVKTAAKLTVEDESEPTIVPDEGEFPPIPTQFLVPGNSKLYDCHVDKEMAARIAKLESRKTPKSSPSVRNRKRKRSGATEGANKKRRTAGGSTSRKSTYKPRRTVRTTRRRARSARKSGKK